jgi:prevent-host-death family protein
MTLRLPLANFRCDAVPLLDRLKETGEPIVLTDRGRGQVVVQDIAAYRRLLIRVYNLEEGRPLRDLVRECAKRVGVELERAAKKTPSRSKKKVRPRGQGKGL